VTVLLWATVLGALSDRCRLSIAIPSWSGSTNFSRLSRPDRRGRIRLVTNRPWLLRSSHGCSCRPALRWGWPPPAWSRPAAFPCSAFITGRFRSALYTGSPLSSRRNDVKHPDSTAYLLVPASQPHLAGCALTMLTSVQFVLTMSSHSSPTPDWGSQVRYIVGKASHPWQYWPLGQSPSDARFPGIPAATRRAWSGSLQPNSIECNFMSR